MTIEWWQLILLLGGAGSVCAILGLFVGCAFALSGSISEAERLREECNAQEIVKAYLKEKHYDGLCHVWNDCACEINDLAPCGSIHLECEPGHRAACDCGDHDFHIVANTPLDKTGSLVG